MSARNNDHPRSRLRPAAFLDRDGVLVEDRGYAYKIEELYILPNVAISLKKLQALGYLILVVSNQAGVARGYFEEDSVRIFHRELASRIEAESGAIIDAFYFCPHHPDGSVARYAIACSCRKPGIGMLEQAARDFAIDWTKSFLVGDRASDIDCANNAGIPGFQIASNYEMHARPFANVKDLPAVLALLTLPQ